MFIDLPVPVKCGECGSDNIVKPVNQRFWAEEVVIFRCSDCGHEKRGRGMMANKTSEANNAYSYEQPKEIIF